MKTISKHITLFSLICSSLLISSCADNLEYQPKEAFQVLPIEGDYFSRDLLVSDGKLIATCVGNEELDFADDYGNTPSKLIQLSTDGSVIDEVDLPSELYVPRKTIRLANGNLFVIASDTTILGSELIFATIDLQGKILKEYRSEFFSNNGLGLDYSIDCTQLRNGDIAVVVSERPSVGGVLSPHLLIFSAEVDLLKNQVFGPNTVVLNRNKLRFRIIENPDNSIAILGRMAARTLPEPEDIIGFILNVDPELMQPISFRTLSTNGKASTFSNAVINGSNDLVFVTSASDEDDLINTEPFQLRYIDEYYAGSELKIWKTNSEDEEFKTVTGYPKNGFIRKIIHTTDGGYLLVGTCNINSDPGLISTYRPLIIKLDTEMNEEWILTQSTSTSLLLSDVIERPTGYTVFGSHFSFDNTYKPLILTVSFNGKIQ